MMSIVAFLIVIGISVILHEMGHFLAARKCDVQVHEFAFGMGPALYKRRKGETIWSFRIFPIGGFVRLAGMGETQEGEIDDPRRSFYQKSAGARALLLASGPLVNVLLAFLLSSLFLWAHGVLDLSHPTVGEVMAGFPAEEIGLRPGDTVVQVGEVEVKTWIEMSQALREKAKEDGRVDLVVKRNGEKVQFSDVELLLDPQYGIPLLGIRPAMIKYPPHRALTGAFTYLWQMSKQMVTAIIGWISGRQKVEVAGPLGIAAMAGEAVKEGWWSFISFLAVINLNLGILNLVPFPALDGGRLLFVLVEMTSRKKVSERLENYIHMVGFAVLIGLILLVTWQDVMRLLK
ncbi:MAG: RIP metalloprotease [Synergistales bacterium]|nr:RIP metalloprotease [Synergistales bacterium]MDI9390177.1 M50 family metallopeptidase [Synergistota bacterium]